MLLGMDVTMQDHQAALGERLRGIRRQQGLTLQDVEERSRGQWKAVVVGSYERGDRAISISKLSRLADFYGVPLRDLLPPPSPAGSDTPAAAAHNDLPRICLDLTRLPAAGDSELLSAITRYARRIQIERGDYNGRMLTIRRDDLHALARAFGAEALTVMDHLDEVEVLVH